MDFETFTLEVMDSETFTLEVPERLLRKLIYAEVQLSFLTDKLWDDESHTLADQARNNLHNINLYLGNQLREVKSQKSD